MLDYQAIQKISAGIDPIILSISNNNEINVVSYFRELANLLDDQTKKEQTSHKNRNFQDLIKHHDFVRSNNGDIKIFIYANNAKDLEILYQVLKSNLDFEELIGSNFTIESELRLVKISNFTISMIEQILNYLTDKGFLVFKREKIELHDRTLFLPDIMKFKKELPGVFPEGAKFFGGISPTITVVGFALERSESSRSGKNSALSKNKSIIAASQDNKSQSSSLQETLVENLNLVLDPNAPKYFISLCVRTEKEIAQNLVRYLQNRGKRTWCCLNDINSGAIYRNEIVDGLDGTTYFICFLSKDWTESSECQWEYNIAERKHNVSNDKLPTIVPLILDDNNSKFWERGLGFAILANYQGHFIQDRYDCQDIFQTVADLSEEKKIDDKEIYLAASSSNKKKKNKPTKQKQMTTNWRDLPFAGSTAQITYQHHRWLIRTKNDKNNLCLFWATTRDSDSYSITINKDLSLTLFALNHNAKQDSSYFYCTDKKKIEERLMTLKTKHIENWQYTFNVYNKSGQPCELLWIDYQGKEVSYTARLNG